MAPFSDLLKSPACKMTIEQGYCYNTRRAERFMDVSDDYTLDYAGINGEIDDLRVLGKHLCRHAGVCYRMIREAVLVSVSCY